MIEEIKQDNNCIVKAFENNPISILHENIDDKKVYYFRASDIGKALNLTNIAVSIQNYDDDEKVIRKAYDLRGCEQDTSFLTSQGVYRLLYNSKKDIAKKFRKWAGAILDDIIFNESKELQKQLQEQQKQLNEKDKIIKLLENKPQTEGFYKEPGYIYLVKDTSKPGHYKIGLSSDPNKRLIGLNIGSSTNSMEITNTYECKDKILAEKVIHSILHSHKIKKQKEWFYIENELLLDFIIKSIKDCIEFTNKYVFNNIDEEIKFIKQKTQFSQNKNNNINNKYIKLLNKEIQTDIEAINEVDLQTENKDEIIFNKFLNESCDFNSLSFCSKRDLICQYKIWSKINNIFNYINFEQYILTRFKSKKMMNPIFNIEMCCILGINLKSAFYNFKFEEPHGEIQKFLIESCVKLPTGKLNKNSIKKSYEKWCNQKVGVRKMEEIYNFLDKYFFKDYFHAVDTSYIGWYGITLKEDVLKGTGLGSSLCKKNKVFKVYVDEPTKIAKEWDSQKEAARNLGLVTSTIKYRLDNKVSFMENNKEFYLIRESDFKT